FNVLSTITHQDIRKFSMDGAIEFVDKEPVMDLNLNLNKFNLGAFKDVGGEVISNIRGLATGNATFMGTFKNPEMEGRIYLDKAGLSVPYLNVDYAFQENSVVDLTQRQFLLRNIGITDTKYNSKGVLNGTIRHNRLEEWKLDIELNSDYINVLDTQDSDDAIYYGKAFISGKATIAGPTDALVIDVNATSRKGTSLKIPIAETEGIGENTYIHFVTREEKYSLDPNKKFSNRNYQGLEMNFDLTITEDAEIEVILDKETGHLIRGKGFGYLALNINTLGKFNMWGDIGVNEGIYNFKYRGLISKQFKLKKGGSIVWEGDPMRARLNLEAIYDNIRANPAVMLENTTVNQKVPVVLTIGITGSLNNPEPDFFIEFPTISSVLKSEIETKLNDKDTRQTQALHLLATGNFLSQDGSTSQTGMANNLFETFAGVFNDIIGEENSSFNVELDVVTADRTPGRETDGSVGFTGSFEINERISVNGKLGVPIGGINDAAVVGNVEILYRVNEDGSLNMRVFNRENDITYIGEGIGYTQGIGVSYQVDFNTFRELITKVFKNAKLTKDTTPYNDVGPDSEMLPEHVNILTKKKPPGEAKKEEEERTPEID
ncbi:translocation/assembly module TamB domain-containing protein, partial [Flavobacterium sp.]|uniref:translocation/assembly module TamB domain-containing protein n=1 Tax=Flavobacterium sp. TaxID=239 RepID=UPI0037C10EC6